MKKHLKTIHVSPSSSSVQKKSLKSTKPPRIKGDVVKKSLKGVKELITIVNVNKNWWHGERKWNPLQGQEPKHPGRAPVPKEKLLKYSRGDRLEGKGVKSTQFKKKLKKREKAIEFSTEQAARAELLLTEESGYLEADEGEVTTQFTQKQIADNVDITSATKHFELQLNNFGPYRMNYSRNGRCLLLGGRKGHVAAFDWVTKRLYCEMNVMENIFDVQWLHTTSMFAVAQKQWVYMYDNQGIELHCVKNLDNVLRMEFLPYHFLLATASDRGFLSWLDISIGKMVTQFNCRLGRLNIMTQNPYNAVLCLGHSKGIVTMWSPNMRDPLAKMLCHPRPLSAIAVDPTGRFLATAATDRSLKMWDVRMLEGPLQQYELRAAANSLTFSQRGLLAVGMGNVVEVYRDCCLHAAERTYLRHKLGNTVANMEFCPFEDVLGVATGRGFTSLIVPGCAEPNFDALEVNPFQTKSQRREAEVKSLLEKIQPELITLDPSVVAEVDVPTLQDKIEAKKKLLFLKPVKIDYNHNKKGGSTRKAQTKKILREQGRKEFVKAVTSVQAEVQEGAGDLQHVKPQSVLDRFKVKR